MNRNLLFWSVKWINTFLFLVSDSVSVSTVINKNVSYLIKWNIPFDDMKCIISNLKCALIEQKKNEKGPHSSTHTLHVHHFLINFSIHLIRSFDNFFSLARYAHMLRIIFRLCHWSCWLICVSMRKNYMPWHTDSLNYHILYFDFFFFVAICCSWVHLMHEAS